MLCYLLYGPGDLRAEEHDIPTPGPGEALVKIIGCAICHTDLAIIDGHWPFLTKLPKIIGHEYAGTVVALGPGTTSVAPGDRVAVYPSAPCGLCLPCRRGTFWLCLRPRALSGGFAEYAALPEQCLFRVLPQVTDEQALSVEPFSVAVHSVDLAQMQPGDTVVVIGGGAIGLVIVGMLRAAGAGKIIVSEPDPSRRPVAVEFGADVVLDPRERDLAAKVKALTGGMGADVVFEAVGLPQTVEQCFALVRRGGTIIIVGVALPEAEARFKPFDVFAGHLTIRGSWGAWWTIPRTIDLLPKVRPERVLTHRFPLAELPRALELRRKQVGIKAYVIP
ncbi:MAG: zinc-binding dehydrogenase [Chloroflexi bacterium]|nr:zinc-binding dehydrogenase [Chloroflexota bacterium]